MTCGMDFAIIFGFQELLGISDQAWELSAWVPTTQGRSQKTSFPAFLIFLRDAGIWAVGGDNQTSPRGTLIQEGGVQAQIGRVVAGRGLWIWG